MGNVMVVRQLLQVWEVLMVVAHLHGDVLVGRRNLCHVMVVMYYFLVSVLVVMIHMLMLHY
jgi:hypothetical protein